jgi:hypothetical protein
MPPSIWVALVALGLLLGALARPLVAPPSTPKPTPAFAVPVPPDPTPAHGATPTLRPSDTTPAPPRTFEAFPHRADPGPSDVPEIAD